MPTIATASQTGSVNPWIFSGYMGPIDGFCEMPAKMVNIGSGEWYPSRCGSARPSRCEWCSEIHRGDVAAVGRSGWTDSPVNRGFFVTLTAPGVDRLPWDRDLCHHSGGVPCSGTIGCQVEANALAVWHHDVGQRWSWFITEIRRELPGVDVQFFKTWEPQARGALHAHSMMRPVGVVSVDRFRSVVVAAAKTWGFGDQVDVQPIDLSDPEQAARKAGYCAKYATKCADALPLVRRLNPQSGELKYGGMRSWSASRQWGETMASVKQRRCLWAMTSGATASAGVTAGGGLDSYQDHYAEDRLESVAGSVSAAHLLV